MEGCVFFLASCLGLSNVTQRICASLLVLLASLLHTPLHLPHHSFWRLRYIFLVPTADVQSFTFFFLFLFSCDTCFSRPWLSRACDEEARGEKESLSVINSWASFCLWKINILFIVLQMWVWPEDVSQKVIKTFDLKLTPQFYDLKLEPSQQDII